MSIQEYLPTMFRIQENILAFLENDENSDEYFQIFINFLRDHNIQDKYLIELLNLISKISESHYRKHNLIIKIEKILTFLKDDIKSHISNASIYNLFRNNKRILLFLIEEQFITIDEYVYLKLKDQMNLMHYFEPEIASFTTKEAKKVDPTFEKTRRKGENENYICKLIRKDSIEEFIIYVNKLNIILSNAQIKSSIFETNSFLLERGDISLIEYAAFYGSIQIFNYLHLNEVELTSSLWLFAIHSNNPELIYLLEENHVESSNNFIDCFEESIKCYHNEIAIYFKDNLLTESYKNKSKLICFNNFNFFTENVNDPSLFPSLCKYNYFLLVSLLIDNINKIDVFQLIYFKKKHFMMQLKMRIKKLFGFY